MDIEPGCSGCLGSAVSLASRFRSLEQWITTRYARWLDERIPPRREITLIQNNIFIYPIWQFSYFFAVILMLWIGATNYENNMSFALAFLLLGVFVVCIIHTFNNLSGLKITVVGADPVFAGEYADVELILTTTEGKQRDAIELGWEYDHRVQTSLIDTTQQRIRVPVRAVMRGLFNPKRITIETVYPLGIIRAVSYLDLDVRILAYPRPVRHAALLNQEGEGIEGEKAGVRSGIDEFSHLDDYQPGMSLKKIAWKQFAKGRDLQVKEYVEHASAHRWLNWEALPTLGTEERLSTLCYWALEFEKSGHPYGLNIPGAIIQPGTGALHLQQVLTALAMYGSAS